MKTHQALKIWWCTCSLKMHVNNKNNTSIIQVNMQDVWVVLLLLFLVSRPYVMPKLWGGGVPTSDSRQFSPRLWVPNPYSLSPTRQSKPAFQWQGTNERIHRQWQQGTKRTKDRHGGHQFTYRSQLPHLWHEGPSSFQNSPERPLPSSVRICYYAWVYYDL